MKQDQKSYFCDLRKSRSGQAVVEYVLLLVVIVGLILASAKIFKTIDQGMQKYIGDYFVCLMEYGELPTLGVGDQDLKKHIGGQGRKCDNQFEAFTFENGRPATPGGGGTSGSSNNGSNSQNGSDRNGRGRDDERGGSSRDSAANRDRDGKESGSDDTGDGSDLMARGRNGSGSSSSSRPEVKKAGTSYATLDGGSSDQSNIKVIEEDGESDSEKERNKRRRPKKTRLGYADEYRAIGGRALQEIERAQKRRGPVRKPTSTVLKINADEGISGPYRKTVTPPERKVAAEIKDKGSGFTFGSFFKWLLIAGMVVAIIVFFGGQLLNYSNSE